MKSVKTKTKTLTATLFSKGKTTRGPSGIALKLVAPTAKQVCVAGTFNEWRTNATPLKPTTKGEWRGELKLSPGRYEYLFVVDGEWTPDPAARETAPNPFGGMNSVISVG